MLSGISLRCISYQNHGESSASELNGINWRLLINIVAVGIDWSIIRTAVSDSFRCRPTTRAHRISLRNWTMRYLRLHCPQNTSSNILSPDQFRYYPLHFPYCPLGRFHPLNLYHAYIESVYVYHKCVYVLCIACTHFTTGQNKKERCSA